MMSARHEYFRKTTCPACNLLPLGALSQGETPSPVTIRLDELDLTAVEAFSKCEFCRLLTDLHRHWESDERDEQMAYDGVTYRQLCGREESRIRHTDQRHLGIFVDFDGVLAKRVDDHRIYEDPLCDHSIKLIKHWMAKCARKHHSCFSHPTDLPTRVIDISENTIKLIDPSPHGAYEYIALSHCWGTCRSFLTTRENLEDRKRGFLMEELPATFQDAVKVTRNLGIPYLWIDSICILQGDKDDWEIEGSKMADVYANATLTIAAANASDDAEGFLKLREQEPTLAIDICLPSANRESEDERRTRIYTRLPPTTKLIYEPLDGRAWCLQERYLSPRILFFTSASLRWECLENGWFEAGRGLMKNKLMLPDVMPERREDGTFSHVSWYKMVELYTTRAITYAGDKLPALSALASCVAQLSNDEYLAGLWRSDIINGLLWYRQVRHRFRDHEPTAPYRDPPQFDHGYLAPTWSWASFPGAIQFEATVPSDQLSKILPTNCISDAATSVPGKNPYGQVASGSLSLNTALLSFEPADGEELSLGAWEHNMYWCLELEDFEIDMSSTLDYPKKDRKGVVYGVPLVYIEHGDDLAEEGVENGGDVQVKKIVEIHGILVKRREEGRERVFERVGCFKVYPIRLCDVLNVSDRLENREIKIV